MDDNVDLDFLHKRIALLSQKGVSSDTSGGKLKADDKIGTIQDMDLTQYRLEQTEKRAEAADARMSRIENQLTQIQISLAGLATKDSIRNWGIGVIAIVIATGIGVGAMMIQSSSNQLSAFQAGLSAIQAVAAAPSKK